MAEAAKVIRIELRVRGSSPMSRGNTGARSSGQSKKKIKKSDMRAPDPLFGKKQQLATAGYITAAAQLVSQGFSIYETLSYNSDEKTQMMMLNLSKTAVSTAIVGIGTACGGVIGAAIGVAINQLVVNPVATAGATNIQRHLDQTRASNRFYQTNFAGKGTFTFDYSSGSYINEDLEKVKKGSFYKKGGAV